MLQDIKYALRLLIKDRSFAITALVTLAVCTGANAAMFGIVRSVLLKPLPFPDSSRLVLLYNSYPAAGAPRVGAAVPDYFDRLQAVPALDQQALFRTEGMTFGDPNGAERLLAIRATPSFYRLVRVQPAAGRMFTEDEGQTGKNSKAILSDGFARRKFGSPGAALHQVIRLNGTPYDVVGVMPATFSFLENDVDLYAPAAFTPDDRGDNRRHSNNWQMVGHLRPGATVEQVQQQVDALNAANDKRFPEFHQILKDAQFHTVAVRLQDDVVRDVKKVLYLLWGGVLFVLLIGCVNIANLVIVRASSRTREMATRHAIGADLSRLARQLLTETTLLAVAGGALGLLLGWWTLRSVSSLSLDKLPRGYEIGIDPVTIAVIAGVSVVVGLALGVAPALSLRRMNLNVELREEVRGGTSGRRANLVRRALATSQVAIAFVLLVGAGLLLASFRAILRLDLGFQPANVATASLNTPATSYKDDAAQVAFTRRALAAIRALPEVEVAGLTTSVPFSGSGNSSVILAEGHVMQPGESLIAPSEIIVSPGYFSALRIPIVRGRDFEERDTAEAPHVAIVDERLAQKFWPDKDPIGRRLYEPDDPKDITKITKDTHFYTVVGVVRNIQTMDPRLDIAPVGTYYFPYEQQTPRGYTLVVRTRGADPGIYNSIRHEIVSIDPQLPLFRTRSMQQWIDEAFIGRRVPAVIASAFGVVALFLAAVGIYGVLAFSVAQRRRELGVRMALGSTAGGVFALVLKDGLTIIGAGLVVGLALALAIGQVMKSQLYGVGAMDPLVLAGVAATLVVIALVATIIPSWRASTIDPVVVLGK